MIETKSIYYDSIEPEDGYRLLVMRYWPRGVRKTRIDGWIKELAPSKELLSQLRDEQVDWPEFSTRYWQEIRTRDSDLGLFAEVKKLESEHDTVILICHEDLSKPGVHCHRELLKEMLETV